MEAMKVVNSDSEQRVDEITGVQTAIKVIRRSLEELIQSMESELRLNVSFEKLFVSDLISNQI